VSDTPKLPTHIERYVIWNKSANGGKLITLVGYCPDTLAYYKLFFEDAQESVPEIREDLAICGKVQASLSKKNFTLMVIPIEGEKRVIDRFEERPSFESIGIDSY